MNNRKVVFFSAAIACSIFACKQKSAEPKNIAAKKDTQKVAKVIEVNNTVKISNFDFIEGVYIQKPYEEGGETCNLTVKIEKFKSEYYYTLSLPDSVIKGKVTVSKNDSKSDSEYAVTLEGIEWASYEGDVSDENKPPQDLEIPIGIGTIWSNKEMVFQNYGNSMNSYTVLDGCGQKYIRLVKQ